MQPLWKAVWRFLRKMASIKIPYDPVIPFLDVYKKKKTTQKVLIQQDTHTSVFIAALFIIAKIWKQPKCPLTDEWVKKL